MMRIDAGTFVEALMSRGLDLWAGVPDSLLKDLCACASDRLGERFVVTANEGNAVGMACGWHVATGGAAAVFMQNSGLGNAANPLLSLADPKVYSLPMLLVVGWRGEPGVKDEPQHAKQGEVTLSLLEAMGTPCEVLDPSRWEEQVSRLLGVMREESRPVAIVVRRGAFGYYPYEPRPSGLPLTRETALGVLLDHIGPNDLLVATTGKEGRELFELRDARGESHDRDLLCVGGMGHTLSVSWGMAIGRPDTVVWCLDGDGSLLMHMGSVACCGGRWPRNLRYVVNVNGAHESVGGQPNAAADMDVPSMLRACGTGDPVVARTLEEVGEGAIALSSGGVLAMVLYTRQGSRPDLGRPTESPSENKRAMMALLGSSDGGDVL